MRTDSNVMDLLDTLSITRSLRWREGENKEKKTSSLRLICGIKRLTDTVIFRWFFSRRKRRRETLALPVGYSWTYCVKRRFHQTIVREWHPFLRPYTREKKGNIFLKNCFIYFFDEGWKIKTRGIFKGRCLARFHEPFPNPPLVGGNYYNLFFSLSFSFLEKVRVVIKLNTSPCLSSSEHSSLHQTERERLLKKKKLKILFRRKNKYFQKENTASDVPIYKRKQSSVAS